MELYYFPSYSGNVYLGFESENIKYSTKVVDTEGLVNFFCLHAGIIFPNEKKGERLFQYCDAMSNISNSNVFANSFKIDPINTAIQCLKWRDALRLANWSKATKAPGNLKRLQSLQEIETKLHPSFPVGLAEKIERLKATITASANQPALLPRLSPAEKITIHIPCAIDFLHPAVKDLLGVLGKIKKGKTALVNVETIKASKASNFNVSLTNALSMDDIVEARTELQESKQVGKYWESSEKFEIIHFKQLKEATQYLAFCKNDYDVWINTSNTTLPYYKASTQLPHIEERTVQGMSQCRQLLIAGLNLFFKPLNLQTLVQWLSLPTHPLESDLRWKLNNKIGRTDSLFNEKCKTIIKEYVDSKTEPRKSEIINEITTYIPSVTYDESTGKFGFDTSCDNSIEGEKLEKFLDKLAEWVQSNVGAKYRGNDILAELPNIAEDIELVKRCLGLYGGTLTSTQLTNVIQLIYDYPTTINLQAEVGSPNIVNSPELIASKGTDSKVLWCDFYGDMDVVTMYDFLSQTELANASTMGLTIWQKEAELKMHHYFQLIPFIKSATGKLTLITCEGDGPTSFHQHPIMAHMKALCPNTPLGVAVTEQNALRITDGSKLLDGMVKSKFSQPLCNTLDAEGEPYYLIPPTIVSGKWPTETDNVYPTKEERKEKRYEESYSSVNELIYHPLNYCFKYIAGIYENNFDALSPAYRLKGNIVHKVIEKLFGQFENQTPNFSEKEFNQVFEDSIDECALVFREPANTFELQSFKEKAKVSVMNLQNIIVKNNLIIGGCESEFDDIKFFSATNIRAITPTDTFNVADKETADKGFILKGSIDMWLYKEVGGQKKYYIFDFKWSSKEDKYIKKLQENTSIQLCLYKYALQAKEKIGRVEDISTAYYVLASAKLFTCADDIQDSVKIIPKNALDSADLLGKIMNSYEYRKEELKQGMIEDGEHLPKYRSNYTKDVEAENLLPLEFTKMGLQEANPFNDYRLFTTNRK